MKEDEKLYQSPKKEIIRVILFFLTNNIFELQIIQWLEHGLPARYEINLLFSFIDSILQYFSGRTTNFFPCQLPKFFSTNSTPHKMTYRVETSGNSSHIYTIQNKTFKVYL